MTEEDLKYWREVLEGEREADPANGVDAEDLALMLIDAVVEARQVALDLLVLINNPIVTGICWRAYPWIKEANV